MTQMLELSTTSAKSSPPSEIPPFRQIDGKKLVLHFHAGQTRAWESEARFPMLFGGTQVGKTCFAPHWLDREIKREGPGDYLAITATFPLLKLKLLPEFLYVFDTLFHYGSYNASDRVFYFRDGKTRVIFGSATNPESIESATAKAAILDEIGQKQFRRGAWEAVLRRLSLNQGRALGTTTLYQLGWLKNEVYDRWLKGDKSYDVIQVDSIVNPAFPRQEYHRAKATLPRWKFNLFYRGRYDKPAGLIYDAFDEDVCKIPRHDIPKDWPRYVGMDFGGANTAAMFYALNPYTGELTAYREYLCGGKSAEGHAESLQEESLGERITKIAGGAPHEDGWREAFTRAGWHVVKPREKSVATGIDRVYAFHKRDGLYVFDDLDNYLDEKQTYSYKLDDKYEPTDEIEDKARFHLMDAERYIISEFRPELAEAGRRAQVWRYG